jgi:hypothetical protein
MDKRATSVAARQRRLWGIDGTERNIADLATLVLRLVAGQKVTEGDVHLARIRCFITAYQERQRSDFELGEEPVCQSIDDVPEV